MSAAERMSVQGDFGHGVSLGCLDCGRHFDTEGLATLQQVVDLAAKHKCEYHLRSKGYQEGYEAGYATGYVAGCEAVARATKDYVVIRSTDGRACGYPTDEGGPCVRPEEVS